MQEAEFLILYSEGSTCPVFVRVRRRYGLLSDTRAVFCCGASIRCHHVLALQASAQGADHDILDQSMFNINQFATYLG